MGSLCSLLRCIEEEQVINVPGAPWEQEWYHGKISDALAENRLKRGGVENGAYLVYDGKKKGEHYYLLVMYKRKPQKFLITRREVDGKYVLGQNIPGSIPYDSVEDVIEKHKEGMLGFTGRRLPMSGGGTVKLQGYVCLKE